MYVLLINFWLYILLVLLSLPTLAWLALRASETLRRRRDPKDGVSRWW